jgi:hypothetical protein
VNELDQQVAQAEQRLASTDSAATSEEDPGR